MRRISFSILIACAILCLGAGVGIGYAIEASHSGALDSDIAEKESQITAQQKQINSLTSETAQLQSELLGKQVEYDLLQKEFDSTSEELNVLRINYNALDDYYRNAQTKYNILQNDYETLLDACDGDAVDEIIGLRNQVTSLQGDNAWLKAEVARLEKEHSISPDHALDLAEVFSNPKFQSTTWAGRDYELRSTLEGIGESYDSIHTYIEGEFDCNDMAIELWNILLAENIKSVIVIGDRDKADETFEECNHAWLYVFDATGSVIYMEPTNGQVIYGRLSDGTPNPVAAPYRDGFIYEKPSDLWKDLCHSTHNW